MTAIEIVLMILMLIMGVFLVVSMLLQKSKKGLSGTIAGGADTYYSKDPTAKFERILSTITAIVGIVFIVLVLVTYVIQPNYGEMNTGKEWQDASQFFSNFVYDK